MNKYPLHKLGFYTRTSSFPKLIGASYGKRVQKFATKSLPKLFRKWKKLKFSRRDIMRGKELKQFAGSHGFGGSAK